MIRIFGPLLASILFTSVSFAQDCDKPCGSQLLRVEVSSKLLSNGAAEGLLPSLKRLAESPTLNSAIQKSYPLQPLGFPQTLETCLREQAEGDPDFKDIDCKAPGLCANTELNPSVREKICFKLPCPILEGNLDVGKCEEAKDIYPTGISFPDPVTIQKIALTPVKSEFKNGKANLCFRINELDLKMGTSLKFDTSKTKLPNDTITINNINPVLDSPRDVCITANVNLGTPNPVSNIKLEPQSSPFLSDEMIRTASKKLQITGLTGYAESDLKSIQSEVVPVLFQPMRDSIETAVKESLGKAFETQLQAIIKPFNSGEKITSTTVDSSNFMSELGIANLRAKDQLAKTECAYLKAAGREIPPKHACVGLDDFGTPITPDWKPFSASSELMSLTNLISGKKVTSESIKQRLIKLKDLILEEKVPEIFAKPDDTPEEIAETAKWYRESNESKIKDYIDPAINEISNNQMESQVYNFIQIQNQLNQGQSNNIGISLPDICTDKPSPHAGKKIKNCPVQVYADLNEFNKVLDKMWDSGRMCMAGNGAYRPKLDSAGKQAYTEKGAPIAEGGCFMEMSGMGCYLKQAPQIKYDTKTKKYKVGLNLKQCFFGGVLLGIGKFGADFNIDFAFSPKACHNGDFCMDNPDVDWSVVKGTERFSMKEGSFLKGIITSKINDAMTGAMKNQIRLPMASGVGPLANVPLQAEGRVDSGPGYFGACLELQKGASGQ